MHTRARSLYTRSLWRARLSPPTYTTLFNARAFIFARAESPLTGREVCYIIHFPLQALLLLQN